MAKPWSGGLHHYVYSALQQCCRAVTWVSTYPQTRSEKVEYYRNKKKWRNKLIQKINGHKCDLAIFINIPNFVSSLEYQKNNVLWVTDNPVLDSRLFDGFARVFVSDPGYDEEIKSILTSDKYKGVLPFAFAPDIHFSTKSNPRKSVGSKLVNCKKDVVFIGNRDCARDKYIDALLKSKFTSTIVGNYYIKSRQYLTAPLCFRSRVPNNKMGLLYNQHRVALNIHAAVVKGGTNMRTFECAGYNIPQLVDYRPGLEDYFEFGKEIEIYHDEIEMIEKLEKLVKFPDSAAEMAKMAFKRALKDHTYQRRINTIVSTM